MVNGARGGRVRPSHAKGATRLWTSKSAKRARQPSSRLSGASTRTRPPSSSVLPEDLHGRGIVDVVVDMADCEFVSSAGLRVIVAMQKRAVVGGSLAFRNVQPDVMDVFTMTGFDKILTIE